MAYRGGIAGQFGLKAETTPGTAVTPDIFYPLLTEKIRSDPTFVESEGLRAGGAFPLAARTAVSKHHVGGDVVLEHFDRGHYAKLWKACLGASSGPTQIAATAAYRSILTPGDKAGLSDTMQAGRPQAVDGVVRPFTWRGCKITNWEFSCKEAEKAQLKLTVDGWREATGTALAAASYTASMELITFAHANTIKIGGTASTTSGLMSVAGGGALATVVNGITIKGTTPVAQRYGLGGAGTKAEQFDSGTPSIMVDLDGEFTQRTEFYDLYEADTPTVFELVFSKGDAGGGNPFTLSFIASALKVRDSDLGLDGPEILSHKVGLKVYDDGGGSNAPFQTMIISTDTTL